MGGTAVDDKLLLLEKLTQIDTFLNKYILKIFT